MRKKLLFVLLALVTVAAAGCFEGRAEKARLVPSAKYLVGGGFLIDYEAPSDGTAYLVDYKTKKLLATESLDEGEDFDFDIDPTDDDVVKSFESMGIDIKSADFRLYFMPLKNAEE